MGPIHSYKMKLSVVLVVVALVGMAICEPEPLFKKKGKGGYKGGYGHGIQPSYQHHYYQQQPYYYGYYKRATDPIHTQHTQDTPHTQHTHPHTGPGPTQPQRSLSHTPHHSMELLLLRRVLSQS